MLRLCSRRLLLLTFVMVCVGGAGCQCVVNPERELLGPEGDGGTDSSDDAVDDTSDDGDVPDAPDGGDGCDPAPETCNGLDDNCDGDIDEPFDVGQDCEVPGCGVRGVFECDGEGNVICAAPADLQEICDGEDNDCDGMSDEGFDVGTSCDVEGCPGGGTLRCADETTTECVAATGDTEICDGADNDCNGNIDEGFPLGDSCSIPGCGAPAALACAEDGGTVCQPSGPPIAEVCSGQDDDCDGMTDEGFGVGETCMINGCEGTRICSSSASTECEPSAPMLETCNNVDDDCDGLVDEMLPSTGACMQGGCSGELRCVAGMQQCIVAVGIEICDGMDNDCDDSTDEGFDVGASCSVGMCDGVLMCDGPNSTMCSASPGGAEICNGMDDDCDGNTDEGTEGGACMAGTCSGREVCMAGVLSCEPTGGMPEMCDGDDNDCDGRIDEDVRAMCDTPGCSAPDTATCAGGTLTCTGDPGLGETAQCDGFDTDCDGALERTQCVFAGGGAGSRNCRYRQIGGRSYLACDGRAWATAADRCRSMGYQLARIESAAENSAVTDWLDSLNVDRVWLNARDQDDDGQYNWEDDGDAVADGYNNYAPGEPSSSGECLRLEVSGEGLTSEPMEWGDRPCDFGYIFLCKHPTN